MSSGGSETASAPVSRLHHPRSGAKVAPLSIVKEDSADKREPNLRRKRGVKRMGTTNWTGEQRKRISKIEEDIALKIFSNRSIAQAFKSADDDRSGEIDKGEFFALLEQHKIVCSEEEFDLLWERYDADEGGSVTIDEFTLQYSFPASAFKDFLDNKEEEQDKCRSLPLTVFFFGVFVVLVAFHEMTTTVFQLEFSLKSALTDSPIASANDIVFDEINSVDDVYDWAADVLFSVLFQQYDDVTGDPLPPEDWGTVLTYSHLLGSGLIFAQERSEALPCYLHELGAVYGDCHPVDTSTTESYGLELCDNYSHFVAVMGSNATCACIGGESSDCAPADIDDPAYGDMYAPFTVSDDANDNDILDGKFAQLFYWEQPVNESIAKLDVLHKRGWIDDQTKTVSISGAVYNPELLVYTKFEISFTFDRGGFVDCGYNSVSMLADAYNETWLWGLDALWILMVLSLAWSEVQEMRDTAGCTKKGLEHLEKQGDTRTTSERYCDYWQDGWNYIDWAQVILTLFLSCFWFWIYFDTQEVTAEYVNSGHNSTDNTERNRIVWELDRIGNDVAIYRTLAVLNLFVLMLRFFKAFLGQPRLAIITRTFAVAASDLFHFFIVFVCLFFTFVFAGMFIFGQHLYNYHSVHTAMATAFNALTGEYEWEEVEAVDLNLAIIWWWVFMLLMYLVVLNMLLAIVLNAYNTAKHTATRRVTCWKQVLDAIQENVAGCRGSIKLEQIQDILEDFMESSEDPENDVSDYSTLCCSRMRSVPCLCL